MSMVMTFLSMVNVFKTYGAFTFAILAHDFALSQHILLQKNFVFITKQASLVQNHPRNRPRNCANVNDPLMDHLH